MGLSLAARMFPFTISLIVASSTNAQWTYGPPMNVPRAGHGLAVDDVGHVYAVGGKMTWCEGPQFTATTEVFDGTQWQLLPSLPHTLTGLTAVWSQGYLYAIGGAVESPGPVLANVYRLNTTNPCLGWEQLPSLSIARFSPSSVALLDGHILVIGGETQPEPRHIVTDTIEILNPERMDAGWSLSPHHLKTPRGYCGVVLDCQQRVYAIGGIGGGVHLETVERFDPNRPDMGWEYVASIPLEFVVSNNVSAARGLDGLIYSAGGWEPGELTRCLVYDPTIGEIGEWQLSSSSLNTARSDLMLVARPNGQIMAVGGGPGCPAFTTVEILQTVQTPTGCGSCQPSADLNGDGVVNTLDLGILLSSWTLE